MRIKKVFLTLIFSVSLLYAQESQRTEQVSISFHDIYLGYGLKADYTRSLNDRWLINTGLYYHFNYLARDDQGHAFRNRGWADKWHEHLGLNLGIQRELWSYQSTGVYAFYNALFLRPSLRQMVRKKYYTPAGEPFIGDPESYIQSPIFAVENTVGINIQSLLSEKWGFFMKGGIVLGLFYDGHRHEALPAFLWTDDYEGSYTMAGGLFYTF